MKVESRRAFLQFCWPEVPVLTKDRGQNNNVGFIIPNAVRFDLVVVGQFCSD